MVSGSTPDALAVVDAFFSALVEQTVPVGSCAEAELVKAIELDGDDTRRTPIGHRQPWAPIR